MNDVSPMMKQYRELKNQYPDAVLFFRVGDFYEMFYDDAVFASKILEIALTSRDKNKENGIPLCGLPFHAASGYIKKLIKAGHSVAICEQVEDPALAKGVVRREVVRVITPGTLIEPDLLSPKENNYVAALYWDTQRPLFSARGIGLAFLDISTGDFRYCQKERFEEIESALNIINPKEVILPGSIEEHPERIAPLQRWPIRYKPSYRFTESEAYALLRAHFHVHAVSALGEEENGLIAAGALLAHVTEVQKGVIGTITTLIPYHLDATLRIHPLAQRHLQLVPEASSSKEKTLFQILDHTVTAMGGRAFRHWLLNPLLSPEAISERQDAVSLFYQNPSFRQALRERLQKIADTERVLGRIGLNAANPRDLISLKTSLLLLPEIKTQFNSVSMPLPSVIETLVTAWDNLEDVATLMDQAIRPDPPLSIKDGGVIREGYRADLDKIRHLRDHARTVLIEMEQAERKRTGIDSLKMRYTPAFGYSIEVTETHRHKIPPDYVRKQTLARAERFTTAPLMELENQLVGADETICRLEAEIFAHLCKTVAEQTGRIQEMTRKLATLDIFLSLAEVAHQNRYVRPCVNEGQTIRILEGRHPVLEKRLPQFVPNDTFFDPPTSRLLLITGPNMAGKSTFMQQVALIVLMAQMGSFVPAREATVGVVDQIFARVGAADALSEGMSTFMVEMTEMAQILRQATAKSLIVLDELGRGTSTYDGMSIAGAIAEYVNQMGARTLFATHYHELTPLGEIHEGIRNYHVRVREENEAIIFLRKIVEGGADKSYGIEVGRLAGLPPEIIGRAKEILANLSTQTGPTLSGRGSFDAKAPRAYDLSENATAQPTAHAHFPLIQKLQAIDPHNLTPIEAIGLLAELVAQAKKAGGDGHSEQTAPDRRRR